MSLREQLQTIYDENGRLTPAIVVDVARDPAHPLHSKFEWDDKIAGEKYRMEQARDLIRTVKIRHARADEPDLSVRAFHAVRDGEGHAYRPTDEILADPLAAKILLADMEREWKQLKARYAHFVEFRELVLADMAEAV